MNNEPVDPTEQTTRSVGVRRAASSQIRNATAELRRRQRIAMARRGIRVTVIVPVYNAEPYLPELLASLDDQELDQRQLQVILIDDGSTDGSGRLLDAYAASHPRAKVIHQPNSGWPGQPRNLGLGLARGRWVFFADADDYLAPGALRELADFGDHHDVQLVLPRVGRCGRRRSGRPFEETMIDAPKRIAFRTFTPHKLVRRQFIEDHGIRFPEGKIRLEDGIFFSRCYLLANRMSIVADRDYYFLRGRTDGGNISYQPINPEHYTASVQRIAENVITLGRKPNVINNLLAELIRRKCLRVYIPERFPRYSTELQDHWLQVHQRFLAPIVTPDVLSRMSPANARRCQLVLAGDRDALLAGIAEYAIVKA